jgi:hypothetical protein
MVEPRRGAALLELQRLGLGEQLIRVAAQQGLDEVQRKVSVAIDAARQRLRANGKTLHGGPLAQPHDDDSQSRVDAAIGHADALFSSTRIVKTE